ncbi:MAG: CbiX/SirB N-terminal domain-containing protein [Myxococcota bacterium]|nr:CbiX/SirB N-terminal domain-containing protein [Myxococcota bacterium]
MSEKRALLIVDHGSRQPEANSAVEEIVRMTQQMRPGLIVEYAHMEMVEPDLAEGVARCVAAGAKEIIVHPYLLAGGRHTRETIPEQIEALVGQYPDVHFQITEPVGPHRKLAEIVLQRMDETGFN